eukprot:gnl/TRDRNA2_/TRDRNA2_169766_c0_seq4.p1 gnl/TRDRNA2_/TRDRNA2_169766_c0~~gnl/TRDRNA2_/TRDRNA2_169766_c0_seq4.p1  ORF type:complete len:471 (+),score=71.06 gnl/TRDRNA2_/TRDRNA2_169766_c0_seq4:77-1489(+)
MAIFTESTAPYLCEFLGTFLLVFTVGCNCLGPPSFFAPLSIACVLMVSIYAVGNVSGGHLNPAVSLAIGLSKKAEWPPLLMYMGSQFLGGIVASLGFWALWQHSVPLGPKAPMYEWWQVGLVEVLYTTMLCFVVLNVAAAKRNNPEGNGNQFYALAIGFVIVAGGYAVGGISGACFNPAVSLGLGITGGIMSMAWALLYIVYQVIGAAIASFLFSIVRPEDFLPDQELAGYEPELSTKLTSEFLGTFVLAVTVGLNLITSSPATALSAGAALMCMIYSLGDVSGAHFNPAVTAAVVMSGRNKCSPSDGLMYAAVQILAGLCAGFVYSGVSNGHSTLGFGSTSGPKALYSKYAACEVEFIFTFVLAMAVLCTGTVEGTKSPTGRNYYFALAIGFAVVAGGNACGRVSGGELNPAVTTSISVANFFGGKGDLTNDAIIWSLFQLMGGAFASLIFSVTNAKEYRKKSIQSARK